MVKMISELKDGEHVSGQFLVSNSAKCVNNVGSNYINLELKDSSGVINAKKWESTSEDESLYVIGDVVYIEGEVLKYKESLQIKILSAALVNPDEVDVAKFIKQPPVSKEELVKKFNGYVESIEGCKRRRGEELSGCGGS